MIAFNSRPPLDLWAEHAFWTALADVVLSTGKITEDEKREALDAICDRDEARAELAARWAGVDAEDRP